MADREDQILDYRRLVAQANGEAPKRGLLRSLVGRLFDTGDKRVRALLDQMDLGAERKIEGIPLAERTKTGFADAQYGNVIIEYENDLQKTGDHAEYQLREYLAGNWTMGRTYDFRLIATDGIAWKVYAPSYEDLIDTDDLKVEHVELSVVEAFTLTEDNARAFYFFLDRFLFRTEPQRPTLRRIKQDFGEMSPTFLTCIGRLQEHFADVQDDSEIQVAYDQWRRFLSIAYGQFRGGPRVFLVHTYLSIFAKILAYEVIRPVHGARSSLEDIVGGDAFQALNVENFTDNDFFSWVADPAHFQALQGVFDAIQRQIGEYDFTEVEEDILKGVYQELIDLETRHALGEYYTPDWLCERVVAELDLDASSRVLDPACGSGSFLRAVIARLRRDHPDLSAEVLTEHVVGIDIHPLSVQIAKTTVLLALGEAVRDAPRPLALRVYLANTLRTPEGSVDLFNQSFVMNIDARQYRLPIDVFTNPGLFDAATTACDRLADLTLGEPDASLETMQRTLENHVQKEELTTGLVDGFHSIYQGLKYAKQEGRDGIWAFIIQNSYKPYFLRQQPFDVIVGNPPWLTFSDVTNGTYQDELADLADTYNVMPERKSLRTHLEIAAVFLAHVCKTFLAHRGQLAFVLPRSFFSGDQHDNTRSGRVPGFGITQLWDLDDVEPLFRVPSCVLFAKGRNTTGRVPAKGLPGYAVKGRLPDHNVTWAEAEDALAFEPTRWYLGKLGKRTAFTRYKLQKSNKVNHYQVRFKQGATIVPRNFYFVAFRGEPPSHPRAREVVAVRTDPEQQKYAKAPWKPLALAGRVGSRFLFRTGLSKSILPFAFINPDLVLLPVEIGDDGDVTLLDPDALTERGHVRTALWFKNARDYWRKHRTDRSASMSIIDRIDYQRGLSAQDTQAPFLVLYNSSAKNANAVVVRRDAFDLPFLVDHKAYWVATDDEDEAHFLAAFLNADEPNRMIKAFQSRGLFGARDVHKKILEVPFPRYDAANANHAALAMLGRRAEAETAAFLEGEDTSGVSSYRLGTLRTEIRDHLAEVLSDIDVVVKEVIENQ